MNNNTIDICSLDELSPGTILITYETKKEFIVENEGSNVILSAWTTSAARLKLINAMQEIAKCPGAELLYTVIFNFFSSKKFKRFEFKIGYRQLYLHL